MLAPKSIASKKNLIFIIDYLALLSTRMCEELEVFGDGLRQARLRLLPG